MHEKYMHIQSQLYTPNHQDRCSTSLLKESHFRFVPLFEAGGAEASEKSGHCDPTQLEKTGIDMDD